MKKKSQHVKSKEVKRTGKELGLLLQLCQKESISTQLEAESPYRHLNHLPLICLAHLLLKHLTHTLPSTCAHKALPMLGPQTSDTNTSKTPAAKHSENYRWRKAIGKNLIVKVMNFVKSLIKKHKELEVCGIIYFFFLSPSKQKSHRIDKPMKTFTIKRCAKHKMQ
ncbi:hypothetical protein PoB_000845400 [Plakobranchus ocellatus]|uniref:Uncharacterized protein n=1 Tax=Plakobranchus ocellatus TaxID=259542 RepID=A0AAV3YI49_9GAST|nr:hypothetical protein PoB_000845400 [Plakobranchus ocellatus]